MNFDIEIIATALSVLVSVMGIIGALLKVSNDFKLLEARVGNIEKSLEKLDQELNKQEDKISAIDDDTGNIRVSVAEISANVKILLERMNK